MKQAKSPEPDKTESFVNTDLDCVIDLNPMDPKKSYQRRSSLGPSFVVMPKRKSAHPLRFQDPKKKANSQLDCLNLEPISEDKELSQSLAMIKEQASIGRNSLNN